MHAKVSTRVLSETLGLSLFSVIRGGIELTKRLECLSTCKVYERVGYSPSNERFENQFASSRHDPEIGLGSRHTLKLVVASILLDRSGLLSSKFSKQLPPSYEPMSAVPSPVSCP